MENYLPSSLVFPSSYSAASTTSFLMRSNSMDQPFDMMNKNHIFRPNNGMWGLNMSSNGMVAAADHHYQYQSSDVVSNVSQINNENLMKRKAAQADQEVKSRCVYKKKREKKDNINSKRATKYAFQTRSQVDILDDGYRWRKYGQKAVKNNKFPRSYYRCTYQGCNVKKQVQRLSKDEGIVVTTYDGMHSHPIEKANDNFEHILSQMQIYATSF